MLHPRRIPRRLQVHPEIDNIRQHLHVPLRLHVAAHHPKHQPRLISRVTIAGMIVWKWPAMRLEMIRMFRIKRKKRPAILQGKPRSPGTSPEPNPL